MTYRMTNFCPTFSPTACAFVVAAVITTTPASARVDARTSIPSQLPVTRTVDGELAGPISETRKASVTVLAVHRDVRSTRKHVERVRTLLRNIRKMELRLGKLVNQLSPFQSVPKVRTPVRLLIKNLRELQSAFRSVRKKTKRFDKKVLIPSRNKLKALERQVSGARTKLLAVLATSESARVILAHTAAAAVKSPSTKRGLESTAGHVRPIASHIHRVTRQVNGKVASVRRNLRSLRRGMAGLWKVETALSSMSRKMRPAEKFAARLSKVLNKRISIKIPPFKRISFTVRQVVEAPGKVSSVVLRPLEKLADKALQPILKKTKLQIPMPRGLSQMPNKLNRLSSLSSALTRATGQLSSFLTGDLTRRADRFTSTVKQRIP